MIIFRKISFYIAVISLIAMGLMVWKLAQKTPKPPPIIPPPVKTEARAVAASGLVEAIHENTDIGVPVAGLVTKVYVQVWDKVKAGQPLLQIDDRDLQAQLLTQQANVDVSKAQLARAEEQYQRLKNVTDARAVSAGEVTARAKDIDVADAQLSAAKAAVKATQTLIDRDTVRSPIDGTVLQKNINEGEFASPQSTTPPLVVGDVDEVQVRADVDEQIAPRVQEGKDAIGYIKGETDHPIPLKFVRIEPIVVPKRSLTGASNERVDTRVLQVIFSFPNDMQQRVYVGQQMDLYIDE